ncbi:uncharacterized protein LOC132699568 [Cylas formicarius]|uniref:uncharacterized protein LOC132699568 n=1 Tax=Cylas formicarius TaxID=197179 RepID=UPI00295834F7|nr:uncharacterized protein LOC132699568 [Cylas formicarius]
MAKYFGLGYCCLHLQLLCFSAVFSNIDRVELIMPRYATRGGHVIMTCEHSVPPEQLHKVVWKKGESKIFVYIKGRDPPFISYSIAGATLNKTNSSQKQIQLSNLEFSAGGSYHCVVSMETPSIFSKESEKKDLIIIEPQRVDPKITFSKTKYLVGEILEANCTTAPSRPPPHISWLLNKKKVLDKWTRSFSNGAMMQGPESRAPSLKQLSIEVSQLHYGLLNLTCMATIPGYVNDESDYADIRNATVTIAIEDEMRNAADPSPVESKLSNAWSALRQNSLLGRIIFFYHYTCTACLLLRLFV